MSQHDATVKQLLSDPDFFKGFCATYLPAEILDQIDMSTLKLMKISGESVHQSVDPKKTAKTELADIIYQVKYKASDRQLLLLVHVEHFTHPPKHTVLRVINYDFNILHEWAEMNKGKPLPTIIPIIYCHGKKPFKHPLDVYELFENPKQAKEYIENPILVDLTQFTDEQLANHKVISGAEIMLRHTFDKGRVINNATRDLMLSHFKGLNDKSTRLVLQYSLNRFDIDAEQFLQRYIELNPEHEDVVMTMAEQLKQRGVVEGIQQGVQQGIQQGIQQTSLEIAKNMLRKGADLDFITETTGLTASTINELKSQLKH